MYCYTRIVILSIFFLTILPLQLKPQFIEVQDGVFYLEKKEFRFTGTNVYFLLHEVARGNIDIVDEVYGAARSAGMSVIRTWAFNDVPGSRNALQTGPGEYSERVFRALDYLIYKAAEYDLRLILVLTNNWEDYGGIMQYVRWSPTATTHDDFYTDFYSRQYYKQYVHDILTRINTYTGIKYRDDPAIMSWELINEPTSNDESGRIVSRWIHDMAKYMKSIDANHLVGTGGGGWDNSFIFYETFFESIPVDQRHLYWMVNGSRGVSYAMNIRSEYIDYASAHVYPDTWNLSLFQTVRWLTNLQSIARDEGKPFILGEFGKRANRRFAFETVFNALFASGATGALVWQFPENNRYKSEGYSFDGESDRDAVMVLRNIADRLDMSEIFRFDDSLFENRISTPFFIIRDGTPAGNVETLWYNVTVHEHNGERQYVFGRRGTIEMFIRGLYKSPTEGYVRIKARGDVRKIWIESHVRGQWLHSYSGIVSENTEILIPLADLAISTGHIERLKLYSEEGTQVFISEISIITGTSD